MYIEFISLLGNKVCNEIKRIKYYCFHYSPDSEEHYIIWHVTDINKKLSIKVFHRFNLFTRKNVAILNKFLVDKKRHHNKPRTQGYDKKI